MRTWGVKSKSGGWLHGTDGLMFWTVSRACALAYATQNGHEECQVCSFEGDGTVEACCRVLQQLVNGERTLHDAQEVVRRVLSNTER